MVSVIHKPETGQKTEPPHGRVLCEHPQIWNEDGHLRSRTVYRFFAKAAEFKNHIRIGEEFNVAVLVPSFDEHHVRSAIKHSLGSEYDLAYPGAYWLPETDAPF